MLFDSIDVKKIVFHIANERGIPVTEPWYFYNDKSKRGVYLHAKTLGGDMKFSVHQKDIAKDGKDTQFSFSRKLNNKMSKKGHSPIYYRFRRKDLSPEKDSLLAKIEFPANQLQAKKEYRKVGVSLPHGGRDTSVVIYIFNSILSIEQKESSYKRLGFVPIATSYLLGDQYVHMVADLVPYQAKLIAGTGTSYSFIDSYDDIQEKDLSLICHNAPDTDNYLNITVMNKLYLVKE